MNSYIKWEIFNIDQKFKKSNEILQNNLTFLQNELIEKDEIIKTLLET